MKLCTLIFIAIFPLLAFSQDDENNYYSIVINTGDKPECITCKSIHNTNLDNFLKIDATGSTDVVIKIMSNYTNECIRSVFISAGSVCYISNIPEGLYYLKIAYGYEWSNKVVGSFCFAKFMRDANYQVGIDLLDYYLKKSDNGFQLPSYELVLKVISGNRSNEFDADDVSERSFIGDFFSIR
ncbi:MAG: hypothetical protein IPL53_19135 [Ignavibacteria bacterium]|nr:hypothetical protein [Ignavibacteria bacterium]